MTFNSDNILLFIQNLDLKDWGILVGIIVGITTILTFFGKIIHFTSKIISKARQLRVGFVSTAYKTDIRFVLNYNHSFWSIGNKQGEPLMQIVSRWNVTNVSDVPVRLITARLIKPKVKNQDGHSMVTTANTTPQSLHSNSHFIPPGETRDVSISFYVGPPSQKKGMPLKIKMIVVDQYDNSHRIRPFILKGL